MKQLVQNLKTGETVLDDLPVPIVGRGQVLIRTTHSLVSLGTERMLVAFGNANLIQKARERPDKVKMVLDKVRAEGLMPTLTAVSRKLDEPLPLGYCNAGVVVETGDGVSEFKVGDRVASNGGHAEYVCVPRNLVAGIPPGVSDAEGAFTVIGAIALQGIRLSAPTLGETVVVVGLGLIGLIAAQLLKANGCRVIGIDLDPEKLNLAASWGIMTINPRESMVVAAVLQQTGGVGADAVLITASAKGDDIIAEAASMSRKRGRIILIGVIGLNLNRADFYEKELTFQVSCSYGPGRYDERYEKRGLDYPIGFVRWTEKRNFEAVLHAIASGQVDVKPLITERVELADYQTIYGNISKSRSIASLLVYAGTAPIEHTIPVMSNRVSPGRSIAIIGAGNFTSMTLLPALKKCRAPINYIVSANGLSGTQLAKRYGIAKSTTDYREVLADPSVGLVVVATRHNLHSGMAAECLRAGKDVFVEKPLALSRADLEEVSQAYTAGTHSLTVGFNRRFSPHVQAIKKALGRQPGPINVVATMNAGAIPPSVWVHDLEVGGGRIIGEACHYLDLLVYLTGSPIVAVCMNALGPGATEKTDNASILLRFANGSNGVVNYFSNGHRSYSKERLEIYSLGRIAIMDNFRRTDGYGFSGLSRVRTSIDKGHQTQFALLTQRLAEGGDALIPFAEIENVTLASFAAIESLMTGEWVPV